ncbi:MAG: ThuA domain-containing protein [Bacteroides sp.]|nr:ThuA domain-containing protein [Bacteroides sp.]
MKKYITIFVICILCTGNSVHTFTQKKIKAMIVIVTRQDGSHWWQGGSEAIRMTLENSNLFTVDIHVTPIWNEDISTHHPDFSNYDLVIINYGGTTWTEPTRKSFENYIAAGGGVVVVHSSVASLTKRTPLRPSCLAFMPRNKRCWCSSDFLYYLISYPVIISNTNYVKHTELPGYF